MLNRHTTTLLTIGLGLVAVLPAAASQQALPSEAPAALLDAETLLRTRLSEAYCLREVEAGFEAYGNRYRAEFGPAGFEFLPALGPDAPRDFPVRFELESVRRGTTPVVPGPGFEPFTRHGDRLEVVRGAGLTERFEVRAEGIYQSFVFDQQPHGEGDLVVVQRLTTELYGQASSDGGLELTYGERGGVRIGDVVGIDAEGLRVEGKLRLAGDRLEYTLPESFVASASYPLVLDPLIGTVVAIDDSAASDADPDIATSGGSSLVVWERRFSAVRQEIMAQRLFTSDGGLTGSLIPVVTGASVLATEPAVGYVTAAGAYLVAYSYTTSLFTPPQIYVSAVEVIGQSGVFGPVPLSSSSNVQLNPDVGGDLTDTDNEAFVVWEESGVGIRGRLVTTLSDAPPFAASSTFLVDANEIGNVAIRPRISAGVQEGVDFLVVWELVLSGGSRSAVYGRFYDRNAFSQTSQFLLYGQFEGFFSHTDPFAAGDGETFLVTWARTEAAGGSGPSNVVARAIHWDGVAPSFGSQRTIEGQAGVDEYEPTVALTESNAVVASLADVSDGTELRLRNLNPFTALPVGDAVVATKAPSLSGAVISSAGLTDNTFVTWGDSASDDILGQLYDGLGENVQVGFACGNGGEVVAPVPLAGNSNFTVYLRDSVPLAPTIGVFGVSTESLFCGNCVFRPTLDLLLTAGTDASGDAELAVPLGPNTSGLEFFVQWIVVPPTAGGCLGDFDLSTCLRIGIDGQP